MVNEVELTNKEMAIQYAMYTMLASYFNNSKENVKALSQYRETTLKMMFNSLKRDNQTSIEESVIYYIENHILKELSSEELSDHVNVLFKQYRKENTHCVLVVFDAYFWKLDFTAEVYKGDFRLSHTITRLEGME